MITIKKGAITAKFNKKGACLAEMYYGNRLVLKDGVSVGRYANRIAKGRFTLGDTMYQLSVNENGNTLHGGKDRLQGREWKAEMLDDFGGITNDQSDASAVRFTIVSVDGDQGFPGKMTVQVLYEITSGGELVIKYEAKSDKDTIVNLTNHAYFNLNGEGDVHEHELWVDTNAYTEVDAQLIPTGRILPTEGTDFDLIKGGKYKADLDTNFVLNGEGFRLVAKLRGLKSRLNMLVYTDQPGLQVYNKPEAICLETQHFPDSPNHENFPSTFLAAGEVFQTATIYKFTKQ